jgi:hypothetical protein
MSASVPLPLRPCSAAVRAGQRAWSVGYVCAPAGSGDPSIGSKGTRRAVTTRPRLPLVGIYRGRREQCVAQREVALDDYR